MRQTNENPADLLLQDLLEAWGASQDSVNRDYAISCAHYSLPQLIQKTALHFCLTEAEVRRFLQTQMKYHTTITVDYQQLSDQLSNMSAAKVLKKHSHEGRGDQSKPA